MKVPYNGHRLVKSYVERTIVVWRGRDTGVACKTVVGVMTNDSRLIVTKSPSTRRPPDHRRFTDPEQPRQPAVAVQRVANQRQRP